MPATYSAGTAFLTVTPSFLGVEDALKKQVRQMADRVDKDLAAGMAKGMRDAARQSKGTGAKAGEEFSGAYEREAKKRLTSAYRALPEPEPGVNMRKWDRALSNVRKDMKDLVTQRIGFDVDEKTFNTAVRQMRDRLNELRDTAPASNDRGWFNANQASGQLDALDKFVDEAGRRGGKAGDEFGGAFNTRMKKVLQDGLSATREIKIDADSTPAERKMAELRARMADLESKRIGIDIDAGKAYAELRAIHQELQRLDRTHVRVDVRTDAHEAAAGMGAFIKQADEAGRSTDRIGHSANFTMSRLGYLIALGASLGTAIVPVALAAASAIGAIGTAAIAGVAGVGVFALGISGVSDAVKALNGYQQDQAKSANSFNQAQRRMAGSADQVRMAEMSLANTRRNLAEQAEDGARRVTDAERGVADARRQGGRDAVAAARAVRDAQRDVTRSEEDARDVRRQLNEAIRDATRDMAELDTALSRNNLEQDKSVTAQMAALEALNRLKENPRASEVELRRAKESYDEQTQRLLELRQQHKELAEDREKANKLGVEGDDRVINARKRVADVDERIALAREKLDRTRADQQETEYRSAQRIADAQRQVADAQRAQARQQRDGQYQLAQASNAVEQAQQSQAQAWEQSGVAGGAALEKLNEEMDQLSPAGQRFARFLFGLKGEVKGLRAAAAEPLLPRLQEAITIGLQYLPALEAFIGKVAGGMGDLAIASVDAMGNPVWQRFFGYIDDTAVPALQALFLVGANTAEGLASLIMALSPFNAPLGVGLVKMTEDFARWAQELDRSQGFQDFLDYVAENGPKVMHFLGETGHLFIDLVKAAMPIGSVVLSILTAFFDVINSFPQWALTTLVGAIALVSVGILGLGAVMRAVKFKQQLTSIFGPRMSRMVNTYAIETGRATEQTKRFGKATATVAGMTAAAATRMQALTSATVGANTRLGTLATTAGGPLRRGMDTARVAAFNAAVAMNGPTGFTQASRAAGEQASRLGTAAAAARNGLNRVAGALGNARANAIGLAAGAEVAARTGLSRLTTATVGAAKAFTAPGGFDRAMASAHQRVIGFTAGAEVAARTGLSRFTTATVGAATALRSNLGPGAAMAATRVTQLGGQAAAAATTRIQGLGTAAAKTATGGLAALGRGAGSLVGVLGGPWGVAITGATVAAMYFSQKSGEQKKKVEALSGALGQLGDAYRETRNLSSTSVKDVVAQSTELQTLINNAGLYGVAVEDIARAAAGEKSAQQSVIASLKARAQALWDLGNAEAAREAAAGKSIDANKKRPEYEQARGINVLVTALEGQFHASSNASQAQAALDAAQQRVTASARPVTEGQRRVNDQITANAQKVATLTGLVNAFGNAQSTAGQKADAMRAAIELSTGSVTRAIDQDDQFASKLLSLRDQVNQNKESHDAHATSMDRNSLTALRNRDAVKDLSASIRENYLEDIASGTPMAEATRKHDLRIASLKEEANKLGLTASETQVLIDKYGEIDPNVKTVYDTEGFPKVYNELSRLKFMQDAVAKGWSVAKAEAVWKQQEWYKAGFAGPVMLPKKADGGAIVGPGTKTSDSVLMWGSNGEFMQPANSVDYYGPRFMEDIRQRRIPKEALPGYATGGPIGTKNGLPAYAKGGQVEWPFPIKVTAPKVTLDEALSVIGGTGALGSAGGGQGWRWQMEVLRKRFPGLALYSGFRPNSYTASGGLSYHSRDGGRAVDVPPRSDVFSFIHDTYGKGTKELIWGGNPDRNIYMGKNYRFDDQLLSEHGPYRGVPGPSPHIHWAFDDGGQLLPGWNLVPNWTGQPEPVLSPSQWSTIEDFVTQGMAGGTGDQLHFHFKEAALDQGRLTSMLDARDARARPGRPR